MHIFTYGTLMFPEIWRAVAGGDFAAIAGVLSGYSVYRVREAHYPGIIAARGDDRVRGVVYLDVAAAAIERLDRFEDDFYVRQTLTIECDDGHRRAADAYVVPTERRDVLTDEHWTKEAFVTSGGLAEFLSRFAGFARIVEGK